MGGPRQPENTGPEVTSNWKHLPKTGGGSKKPKGKPGGRARCWAAKALESRAGEGPGWARGSQMGQGEGSGDPGRASAKAFRAPTSGSGRRSSGSWRSEEESRTAKPGDPAAVIDRSQCAGSVRIGAAHQVRTPIGGHRVGSQ